MLENEILNHRLDKVESDIQILYKKVNDVTLTQVQSVTKLDSMLVTLGELKESIEVLKKRPGWLWDKMIVAIISALCGVVVSCIL
ncbi:MAG: hypothetical protein IKU66_01285 [Clostridia bacterium]|jgi:hypothetical protein|nr:hypothetical protein [Clostridia bacterium]MBR5544083.1 hypothetical protein [Clostridia bacterium]